MRGNITFLCSLLQNMKCGDFLYEITIANHRWAVLWFVDSQSACYLSRGLNA